MSHQDLTVVQINIYVMSCCHNLLEVIPVIFIILLYTWTYYTYVVELSYKMIKNTVKQVLYLIVFNILFVMMMWCYFATMCTVHDCVPDEYRPPFSVREAVRLNQSEDEADYILIKYCERHRIRLRTRNTRGYVRYCYECKHIKPDRTHHCSTCEICILKMDHHCPWVAACIGYTNYKKFILYIFYTSIYLLYFFATTVEYGIIFYQTEHDERDYLLIQVPVACILTLGVGLLVFGFFIYHLKMLFTNETTLESISDPTFKQGEDLTFNIAPCYNFTQVFGYEIGLWFLPIESQLGNGTDFYTTWN